MAQQVAVLIEAGQDNQWEKKKIHTTNYRWIKKITSKYEKRNNYVINWGWQRSMLWEVDIKDTYYIEQLTKKLRPKFFLFIEEAKPRFAELEVKSKFFQIRRRL